MKLLLDTHTFWWMVHDDPQLSRHARDAIANTANFVLCSDVTAWEIAIKSSLDRLTVPGRLDEWFSRHMGQAGVERLPIGLEAISRVRELAWHHRDPFDRLLAATALAGDLTLVSRDDVFDAYGVPRVW